MLAYALIGGVSPSLFAAVQQGDQQWSRDLLRQAFRALIIAALPLTALAAGCRTEILALLFPPEYASAAPAFALMFAASACLGVAMLGNAGAVAKGQPLLAGGLMLVQVAGAIGTYAWAIPQHGMFGAAASKLVIAAVFAGLNLVLVYRWFAVLPDARTTFTVVLISGVMFLLSEAFPTPGWPVLVKGSVLLAAGLGVLWALKTVTPHDLRHLTGRGKPPPD
jgi:O-antigen/teichoic acid export membrane protein